MWLPSVISFPLYNFSTDIQYKYNTYRDTNKQVDFHHWSLRLMCAFTAIFIIVREMAHFPIVHTRIIFARFQEGDILFSNAHISLY